MNVVVVGAGLAGLSAAVRLGLAGHRVTVLERAPRPGGRIRTVEAQGERPPVDWGQHLMLGCYEEARALLRITGAESQLRFINDVTPFVESNGRRHGYHVAKLPAPLHAIPGLARLGHLSWLDRLQLGRAAIGARIARRLRPKSLESVTAREWLVSQGQSERSIAGFWEPLVVATLNVSSDAAPASLLAAVVDRAFLGSREDATPMLPPGSYHDLFVAPALTRIEGYGGEVRVRCAARRVVVADGRATGVELADGEVIPADAVVLAVPNWDFGAVAGSVPQLASAAEKAAELGESPIVNVDLWYDRRWFDYPFAGLLDSPVQWLFAHDADGRGAQRVSLVISAADDLLARPPAELVAECAAELERFFPEARGASVVDSFVLKAKRATFRARPGVSALRPAPRTELPNVAIAGDWTATGLPATIEGAVLSGRLAAEALRQ